MKLRKNTINLAEIVNHAFSYTVKGSDNVERVLSMTVEAANIDRRGFTQLLVNKLDEKGNSTMQWIDFETFNIWWQLHGVHAMAS